MNKGTDYLYYRGLYSNSYYAKDRIIKIKLENNKMKYLYFDSEKHIKFTDYIKYATHFSKKPWNYEHYVAYIKKCYKNSIVIYDERIVVKTKF